MKGRWNTPKKVTPAASQSPWKQQSIITTAAVQSGSSIKGIRPPLITPMGMGLPLYSEEHAVALEFSWSLWDY